MKHILTLAITLAILSLAFVSCNDKDNDIPVTGLTLSLPLLDEDGNPIPIELGTRWRLELHAEVTPVFATHQKVTWSSSNPSIVTVDQYGFVTANPTTPGTATITAKIEGTNFAASCDIIVFFAPPAPSADPNDEFYIVTYEVDPDFEALTAFFNNGLADYDITLMSPRLNAWRAIYKAAIPQFEKFTIALPYTLGSHRALAVQMHYTTTANVWPFRTPTEDAPAFTRMTGDENNPNSDATFELLRADRTTTSSGSVPHSSTPPGFAVVDGLGLNQAAVLAAIAGIYVPGINNNTPVVGNNNFISLFCNPAGWTVIRDDRTFWFRSKLDPNDWFVAERQ